MNEDPTVADLLERLEPLGSVTSRAMFGGHGIYLRGKIFGIVDDGRIYFKVDEALKAEFVALGSGPFDYAPGKTIATYFEVPADVLEDEERLLEAVRRSHAAALAGKKKRPPAKQR